MVDGSEKGGGGRPRDAASGSSAHVGKHEPAFCLN